MQVDFVHISSCSFYTLRLPERTTNLGYKRGKMPTVKQELLILVFTSFILLEITAIRIVEKPLEQSKNLCITRDFGYDGTVCVCNSTYCDFVPEMGPPEIQKVHVYESNKAGKRFHFEIKSISNLKDDEAVELFLDFSDRHQKMLGFGGAFTDSTGINIQKLSDATQEMLYLTYFSESGSRYNFGRVPIGGTDFSTRPYTYDDLDTNQTDNYLEQFSLQDEDLKYKISIMKRALEINPEMKFLSSAWSAPEFMKNNSEFRKIGFLKPEYYQIYTNYLVKFLDEYKKHGITFWAISTGNEPLVLYYVPYNTMSWTPETMGKWVTENLGPTLRRSAHKEIEIQVYDDQRDKLSEFLVSLVSKYPEVKNYANGIALHWYMDKNSSATILDETTQLFPDLYILLTEACIEPRKFGNVTVKLGSWGRGEYTITEMLENINHGVVGWVDWNLVLDRKGGPSWALNFVDSPIIANFDTDEFFKQPLYYAMAHFSRFVPRGSVRLGITESENVKATAFETPEETIVIILCNKGGEVEKVTITDTENNHINLDLSPFSWHTVIYNKNNDFLHSFD